MEKFYQVKEEIHFEFTETEKDMRRMNSIMEGDPEGVGLAINEGFEQNGLKQGTSALLDPNQNLSQAKDQDDIMTESGIDS